MFLLITTAEMYNVILVICVLCCAVLYVQKRYFLERIHGLKKKLLSVKAENQVLKQNSTLLNTNIMFMMERGGLHMVTDKELHKFGHTKEEVLKAFEEGRLKVFPSQEEIEFMESISKDISEKEIREGLQ